MCVSHAAILSHRDALASGAQPILTILFCATGFQAAGGLFVSARHLTVPGDVVGAMRLLRGAWRRYVRARRRCGRPGAGKRQASKQHNGNPALQHGYPAARTCEISIFIARQAGHAAASVVTATATLTTRPSAGPTAVGDSVKARASASQ
jgi:hypothetical protein